MSKFKIGDKVKLRTTFITMNLRFERFKGEIGIISSIWQKNVFPYGVKFASYVHNLKYFKASELEKVE